MAAASGFAEILQDSFARGMVRAGAREDIPPNGAYDLADVFLDDAGNPNRRAGSAYKSNAALDATALFGLWDGPLLPGQRTAFISGGNKLGVLSADDQTPIAVYATALSPAASGPIGIVRVGNHVVFPGTTLLLWAGSRKTADYSTGTVSITSGSRALTGTGTSWLANVDAGMYANITGSAVPYFVQSVDSNTQITLDRPWQPGAAAGVAYSLNRGWSIAPSNTLVPVTSAIKLASVANRLAYSAGNQVGFSDITAPYSFSANNYLIFPGSVLALANVRETLLVFTTAGMYAIGGLSNATPSDSLGNALWSYQLANPEVIAWSHAGIAYYQGRAIVPCLDGIWLVDPTSGPTRISDSIRDLYLSYVRTSGYTTGVAAVHANHYFLPILNGTTWVDTLVCRLDTGAWVRFSGSGAKMNALAARRQSPTVLLGADNTTGSRVLSLAYFQPSGALKTDHDGTAYQPLITTRDFTADGDRSPTWKKLRAWWEGTVDLGSPNLDASYQRLEDSIPAPMLGALRGGDQNYQSAVTDDFSSNTIGNYTFDAGGGTLAVSGGQLVPSSTAEKRFVRSDRAYTDAQVTLKFNYGALRGSGEIGVEICRLDANNYLFARQVGSGFLIIGKSDNGSKSDFGGGATVISGVGDSTDYWIRFTKRGNVLVAELFTSAGLTLPVAAATVTLSGADATKFGAGVTGKIGGYVANLNNTNARLDDLTISTPVTALSDASRYGFWDINKRGKQIRVTLAPSGALATWVLHKLAVLHRPSGGQ